jgi:dTDP-4-dehydrorhamnose 3,5-epimerase
MSELNKVEIKPTFILGLHEIHRKKFEDQRGSFERLFSKSFFAQESNFEEICDVNFSRTKTKGTVRGLHLQSAPFQESKLVTCVSGSVFDVVVDLRRNSSTYLNIFTLILTANNGLSLLIPKGCAHGFQSLEDNSDLLYCVDRPYSKENQLGVNPTDPQLQIPWPLQISHISQQDSDWPALNFPNSPGPEITSD